VAESRTLFAQGLTRPFGMALTGGKLYVANDNGVVSFPYADGQTSETGSGQKVFDLPGPPINHHWTKNVVASRDGTKLYATVGSNSNVGDDGLQNETGRAAIWEYDIATGKARIFASGIRNPNGIDFEPTTGVMWTVSNERDEIGNDLPPDFLTSVKDGGFYGWPWSYWGQNVDVRAKPANPQMVAKAIAPDFGVGPHTAALGLAFYTGAAFPMSYRGGAFIGQHGSWNRKPRSGYKVIFVSFGGGRPAGMPVDVLTGFLDKDGEAMGRPVGVAIDKQGALLVADDVGNTIWRVTAAEPRAASAER
jgi:glucose/arabinose dehydrogenase